MTRASSILNPGDEPARVGEVSEDTRPVQVSTEEPTEPASEVRTVTLRKQDGGHVADVLVPVPLPVVVVWGDLVFHYTDELRGEYQEIEPYYA